MGEILSAIRGTPIPTLLIVAGLVFLLLGLTGGFAGKIEIPAPRQRGASIIGGVLVVVGLLVHFVGSPQEPEVSGAEGSARSGEVPRPSSSSPATGERRDAERPPDPRSAGLLADARQWPLVLKDTFADNRGSWAVGEENVKHDAGEVKSLYGIDDGRYRWKAVFGSKLNRWVVPGRQDPTSDLLASVEVRLSAVPDDAAAVGLMFRQQGAKDYQFLLANTGQFLCRVYADGQVRILIPWTRAQTITPGSFNRLAVVAIGDALRLYVNDLEVGVVKDASILSGSVGVVLESFTPGLRAEAEFDNFEIRRKP